MPVLPPGGGVAICAVGRAAWSLEPRLGAKRVWDYTPEEVVSGGVEGVLRCSVGWSGDHRVVGLPPYLPIAFCFVAPCLRNRERSNSRQ